MFKHIKLVLALTLALVVGLAGPASASVSELEKKVTSAAYSQLGYTEPYGNNDLPGKPYDINGPWCGSFLNWAMQQGGVNPQNPGYRGSWNVNVARNWAHYGGGGGGRVRSSTTLDPLPGDLLVFGYRGIANDTGGHVTMIMGPHPDGLPYVWTVGGNESNAVRLQRRNLNEGGMHLVTLTEFRTRKADLISTSTGADTGDVYFSRAHNGGYARLQASGIRLSNGTAYEGSALFNSSYRAVSNLGNYSATQIFATDHHSFINMESPGRSAIAKMAVAPQHIDASRATSGSGTT